MKPHIMAVTGLSAVGKSTLLTRLGAQLRFQHLQASALIRAARQANGRVPSVDHLRLANLQENQRLLVQGFNSAVDQHAPLITLDAHTLIELPNETVLIDPNIFRALKLNSMSLLTAAPDEIAKRRATDSQRQRQAKTADEIQELLVRAQTYAEDICRDLGVPLSIVDSNELDDARKHLVAAGAVAC